MEEGNLSHRLYTTSETQVKQTQRPKECPLLSPSYCREVNCTGRPSDQREYQQRNTVGYQQRCTK